MTLSYKIHAATATTGDVSGQPLGYSFSFPSLSEDDITVTVAGSPKSKPAEYTIVNWTEDAGQNPYIKFVSQTARGTGIIRISRGTTSTGPEHTFQVGSAIKAADLNTCNTQNIYLAQENRDSLNALALGDASSAIQINSANIANLTIQAEDIKSDAVETDKIDNFAVTEGKLAPNAVTNIKVATNAAIQGTKISPDFGSQDIVTTGFLGSDNITITGPVPTVNLTDSGDNPDYSIKNLSGAFAITDNTNSTVKFKVDHLDGHVDLPSHVDIGGGADVTGNLTVTGTVDGRDVAADGTKLDNLNKPLVNINLSASQTLSGNNTQTLIQFNTEISDANNCFDTSTHKFTPNVAGFYFVSLTALLGQDSGTGDIHDTEISVCKYTADSDISDVDGNDTVIARAKTNPTNTNPDQNSSNSLSTIVQMNGSSDFLIFRAKINSGSGVTRKVVGSSTNPSTFFIAYRLQ